LPSAFLSFFIKNAQKQLRYFWTFIWVAPNSPDGAIIYFKKHNNIKKLEVKFFIKKNQIDLILIIQFGIKLIL